jgi:hypothetical protein
VSIILTAWLVLFLIVVGLGQFVRGLFGLHLSTIEAWFSAFWIGYAVAIAALQIWQLCLPIDWRASLALIICGVVGLLWAIIRLIRQDISSPFLLAERGPEGEDRSARFLRIRILIFSLLFVLALAPIALWVTGRALDHLKDYDTGLYHLSSIRWMNEYPIVPGLGNLHYRLAFNQSFFLFVAALNVYPLTTLGFHFANSLLVIVLIAQTLSSVLYLLCFPRRFTPYRLLSALFLPVLIYRISPQRYSANISSPSPDLTVFVLQIVVTLAFTKYLFESQAVENERKFSTFLAIALSVVCITTKLSGAVFGGAMIVLIAIHWLVTHFGERHRLALASRQVAIWILVAGLLIGLPWMVRGIILSGYPVFPSTFGALPLDWRIPIETTREAADWIASFARQPRGDIATVLGSWDWVQGWMGLMQEQFNSFLFVLPLYIFIGAIAASVIVAVILRLLRRRRDLTLWLPFLPALLSAIFWFLGAPDPRFAGSAFWILALWGLVCVLALFWSKPPVLVNYAALLAPIGIAAYLIVTGLTTDFDLNRVRFPSVPVAPIKTYQTASGLIVNMSADKANHLLLWDMPLPTTPYELPGLELRGQDFRDGFRTRPAP